MELKREEMNLYQKINEIQNGAVEISKDGKNSFAHYDYKTFTSIKKAVMDKMRELGVVLLPVDRFNFGSLNFETFEYKTDKGKSVYGVKYVQYFQLINADKPEEKQTFCFPVVGTNNDGYDKASGSAITYALKYLFNEWALLPDESLDPDTTQHDNGESKQKSVSKPKVMWTKDMEKVLAQITKNDDLGNELRTRIAMFSDDGKFSKDNCLKIQNNESQMKELKEMLESKGE